MNETINPIGNGSPFSLEQRKKEQINPKLTFQPKIKDIFVDKYQGKKLLNNINKGESKSDAIEQMVLKMRIEEGKKIARKKMLFPWEKLTDYEQKNLDLYIDSLVKELKKLEQFRTQATKVSKNIIPKKLPRI